MAQPNIPVEIKPVEPPPVQFDTPQVPFLVEVDEFVRASQARQLFKVTGKGLWAAVLDTGITVRTPSSNAWLPPAHWVARAGGGSTSTRKNK